MAANGRKTQKGIENPRSGGFAPECLSGFLGFSSEDLMFISQRSA